MGIRLVTFDALFTLIKPRAPIYVQYSRVFEPHLGRLEPDAIKTSFKTALKELQRERPVYANGARGWWQEVIRRTAIGARADPLALDKSLDEIVTQLMHRFSSKKGYVFYPDALPTLRALQHAGIHTGIITNADARMRAVFDSLGSSTEDGDGQPLRIEPLLISEELDAEKPSSKIFEEACRLAGVGAQETLHVGDELEADYWGARKAGLQALLLRRAGPEGMEGPRELGEDLDGVSVVESLQDVLHKIGSV